MTKTKTKKETQMEVQIQPDLSVGLGQILEFIRIGEELKARFSRFLIEFKKDFPAFTVPQIDIPSLNQEEAITGPSLLLGISPHGSRYTHAVIPAQIKKPTAKVSRLKSTAKTSGRKYKLSAEGRRAISEAASLEWIPCYHPDCKGARRRKKSHEHFLPKFGNRYKTPVKR